MTPNPPSSSDGSAIPPRHRPNLGNLSKDTTETDLWAFDDAGPEADGSSTPARKTIGSVVPLPRDLDKSKAVVPRESPLPPPPAADERIRVNVNKTRTRQTQSAPATPMKAGDDFDDLDHWDEPEDLRVPLNVVAEPDSPIARVEKPAEDKIAPSVAPEPIVHEEVAPVVVEPATQSVSALFKMDLTKSEFIGIIALAAVLLVGGGAFFLNTISSLPTSSLFEEKNHFPIVGKHLTVISAENYWRTPATTEAVRRGTQLIPVVKLHFSGGPAAIRVFFRDAEGKEIGDTVTRIISAGTDVEIAATAGFDDVGMHAAYRTGQYKPWTVDIMEASRESSAGKDFQKLFQMNISAARR